MSPSDQERVNPVTPYEIATLQKELMPPAVIATFNRFIGEAVLDGYGVVYQDDVVKELVKQGLSRAEIFDRGWLNVEGIYREAGWKVEYDKPAYNESYRASFTFTAKKGGRNGSH